MASPQILQGLATSNPAPPLPRADVPSRSSPCRLISQRERPASASSGRRPPSGATPLRNSHKPPSPARPSQDPRSASSKNRAMAHIEPGRRCLRRGARFCHHRHQPRPLPPLPCCGSAPVRLCTVTPQRQLPIPWFPSVTVRPRCVVLTDGIEIYRRPWRRIWLRVASDHTLSPMRVRRCWIVSVGQG